jgi:hypothetical protein
VCEATSEVSKVAHDHGERSGAYGMANAGSRMLEVRWIARGHVPDVTVEWLGPFAGGVEQREDYYFVDASSPQLGVKIRGGTRLDLKAFRGSPGEIALPRVGRGRLELWEKWQFPLDGTALPAIDAPSWLPIRKVRRRRSFSVSVGTVVERPLTQAELPGCALELTGFSVHSAEWWTLAMEATGDPDELERVLRTTAEAVFRDPIPDGLRLDLQDSTSYAQWISDLSVSGSMD